MAMQAITIADELYDEARRSVDFIQAHIFPGSCIPSVTALLSAATRASDLRLERLGFRRQPRERFCSVASKLAFAIAIADQPFGLRCQFNDSPVERRPLGNQRRKPVPGIGCGIARGQRGPPQFGEFGNGLRLPCGGSTLGFGRLGHGIFGKSCLFARLVRCGGGIAPAREDQPPLCHPYVFGELAIALGCARLPFESG